MSERKVLNKYYPPDFDPAKIPKLRLPKNRQYSIRIMAPFNMKCNTCGEYIYKGKKFNSRKETVEEETYLGLYIFRFYIKCPRCISEISFKTDPEKTDYSLEGGATRNFEALRTAGELAEKEAQAKEEEEANNPMKLLENRTKASQREMDMLETLEDLKELNKRHAKVDHEGMIAMATAYKQQLKRLQDEEDEEFINSTFCFDENGVRIKRLAEECDDDEVVSHKNLKKENPTDHLDMSTEESNLLKKPSSLPPKSLASKKKSLGIIIKKKNPEQIPNSSEKLQSNDSFVDTNIEKSIPDNFPKPLSPHVSNESTFIETNTIKSELNGTNSDQTKTSSNSQISSQALQSSSLSLLGNYSGSDSDESV